MPMPRPMPEETHEEFMERCMADDTMHEDMPDDDQRQAVCERQWEDGDGKSKALSYPHVVSYVRDTPWAITPTMLATILDLLAFRAHGGRLTAEEIRERIGAAAKPAVRSSGAIAVLPLFGVISHRANMMNDISGGTSVERFTTQFRQLLNDPSIGAIVLDVDSPGGAVNGVDELSAEIFKARGQKPITAVANSMAASAAYWIATAADELVVIPSGEVGSVGVLAAHEDVSKMHEIMGVRTTLISAGKHKIEGNPFEPLTAEARAYVQERVNDYYGAFVNSVARNRGVSADAVRDGFGQGRMVGAKPAVKAGMADRVETMDDAIMRLSRQMRQGRGAGAEADGPVIVGAEDETTTTTSGTAEIAPAAQVDELDLRRRRRRLAGRS